MSNTFKISTHSTLFNSGAEWSVTLEDDNHMIAYQVYANSLVAAVVAKLGQYALEMTGNNPDALVKGAQGLLSAIDKA